MNLTGVFLLTQAIGKRSMIPRGSGRIIVVASIAGLRGNPQWGNLPRKFNIAVSGSRDDFAVKFVLTNVNGLD